MRKTDNYRRHHEDIRLNISDIEEVLDIEKITVNPEDVAFIVRKLFGKLSTHFAIEDKVLYPKALNHENRTLSTTAKRFQDEMGGLGVTFDAYRKKWPGPLAIAKGPEEFVLETRKIITLLTHRLGREENELYELYDQVA